MATLSRHNRVFVFAGPLVLVGLLSIVPTLRFIRWRRAGGLPDAAAWRNTRGWMQAQLALLVLIPVAAVLMARGIGL